MWKWDQDAEERRRGYVTYHQSQSNQDLGMIRLARRQGRAVKT